MDDVTAVARLARLELTEDEGARAGEELGRFLEFMKVLSPTGAEGDLAHIEPHPLREDCPGASTPRDKLLSNAGDHDGVYFIVPKAVEQ